MSGPAAILDIDGTLVDSNYQHTIAWYRAQCQHDQHVAVAGG
jgi:beta-phosphoglucomutase-like phosphatase (HAD superfamily)